MRGVAIALLAVMAHADPTVLKGRTPAGEGPANVAVNKLTNRIYVANQFSGTVTVIDGKTGKALEQVAVREGAWGLGVDEAANRIYVADFFGTNV